MHPQKKHNSNCHLLKELGKDPTHLNKVVLMDYKCLKLKLKMTTDDPWPKGRQCRVVVPYDWKLEVETWIEQG
jgi:hypothetical protein